MKQINFELRRHLNVSSQCVSFSPNQQVENKETEQTKQISKHRDIQADRPMQKLAEKTQT